MLWRERPPGGNDIGCHVGPFFKNVCWINKYVIRRLFLFYVNFGYVLMSRYFLEGLTRLLDEILNRHELVGKNYDFVAQNWQTKCFNLQFCLKCLLWTCNLRSKIKLVTPPQKKKEQAFWEHEYTTWQGSSLKYKLEIFLAVVKIEKDFFFLRCWRKNSFQMFIAQFNETNIINPLEQLHVVTTVSFWKVLVAIEFRCSSCHHSSYLIEMFWPWSLMYTKSKNSSAAIHV